MSDLATPLRRSNLSARIVRVLNEGGWGNPDVLLVRGSDDGLVVVKDFAPRSGWVRELYGRWMIRREMAAYQVLRGAPAVPLLIGKLDPLAMILEYRPGVLLSRSLAGRLPEGFINELRGAVRAMHELGIVHLDLRHRSNVLAGDDGHPVLIDFASALYFRPGGILSRFLAPLLERIDWGAVAKWESRLRAPAPEDS